MKKSKNFVVFAVAVVLIIAVVGGYFFLNAGITKEAIIKKIVDGCNSDSEFGNKADCFDTALNIKANTELDYTLCNEIKNEIIKSDCFKNVAKRIALEKNNPEICEKIPNTQNCKDDYYMSKAVEIKDENLCDNIIDESLKLLCHDRFHLQEAFRGGDCSLLKSPDILEECEENNRP